MCTSSMGSSTDFNPRSRMGSDADARAPTCPMSHFNPRSRMGSDSTVADLLMSANAFQSTLPHGERRPRWVSSARMCVFQSTLPHGERQHAAPDGASFDLFQSTLPHGERHPANLRDQYNSSIFQSTLPHGERPTMAPERPRHHRISIHAPAWGATLQVTSCAT